MTAGLQYVITSEPIFHLSDREHSFEGFGSRKPQIGDLVTLKSTEPTDAPRFGDDVEVASWDSRDSGAWRISASCLTKVGAETKPTRSAVDEGDLRAVAIGLGVKAADVETLLTLTAIVSAARAS